METRTRLATGTVRSRRQVLGAGLGLVGLAGFAAACSGATSKNATAVATKAAASTPIQRASGTATPATATREAPRQGGTLKAAQFADLILKQGYPYLLVGQNSYPAYCGSEQLTRYRDSLQPEMVLAERLELAPDYSTAVATLRTDAVFHDGSRVTPEDVLFGIDVLLDPAKFGISGALQLTPFARFITSKQKIDDRTMKFTFDRPRYNIGDLFAQLAVTRMSTYDKLQTGQDIEQTGPYIFKSWTPGQGFSFAAFPKWLGKARDGGPYLDGIEVKLFADQQSMGLAFESGDVDLILGTTGGVAKQFKDRGLTRTSPKVGVQYMGANVTNPLLQDKRVRQAFLHAIDRNRLVNEIGEGFGDVTVQPWPSTSPAFDPKLEAPFYDPNKAKDLLKQAGFTQDRPLMLEISTPRDDTLGPVLKDNLAAIGVNVEIAPLESGAYTQKARNLQFKDLFTSSHVFANLTPLTMFQQTIPYQLPDAQGNGGNLSHYASPTYTDIVNKLIDLDPLSAEAKAQYQRFNQMWLDDPWIIPLAPSIRIDLVGPKVGGFDQYFITQSQQPNFGRVFKRS